MPVRVGRNDPCPCGSGRKYKRCCGAQPEAASRPAVAANTRPANSTQSPPDEAESRRLDMARNTRGDAHAMSLTSYHLDVLFDGVKVAGLDFKPLFAECMAASQTGVPPWKVPIRAHRALNLARYYLRTLSIPGSRAECGTLKGFSALLLARVARAVDPGYTGAGMHLVDSFEGLSAPTPKDAVRTAKSPDGSADGVFPAGKGIMACSMEHVQRVLHEFPDIAFHKGWIPDVLKELPETPWAFVHVDVDLYEPTLACLEYFMPRLAPGGVIVNDDYASPMFPGGGIAWDEYCGRHRLAYAALESGQAIFVKGL